MNLDEKSSYLKELFKDFTFDFVSFASNTKSYRNKLELAIFHQDDEIHYAMFEGKKKYIVKECKIANEKIQDLMPLVLKALNSNKALKERLFGVEFLSTKLDMSLTLLYHKDIEQIKTELNKFSESLNLKLIARSRGKKLVFKDEILKQELEIYNKKYHYVYTNECFCQANTYINEKMIEWLLKELKDEKKRDLLELYCGYGNFTLPLSFIFERVVATELSKKNIEFALKNCELNGVKNIKFLRLSSEDFSKAIKKEREFFRLRDVNLDEFYFSHILLDPPRAGLSKEVETLAKNYENIIYISCNPQSLRQNLEHLKEYELKKLALFDQFVDTKHIECIAILKRKV